jgi:hypothetical protein
MKLLKYNPFLVFHGSKTPAALYARQKWMQQAENDNFINDFKETVIALSSGQDDNGSWGNSILNTVHRLFGLHLTVRQKNEQIEKALEWLLSQTILLEKRDSCTKISKKVLSVEIYSLPFSAGCFDHFARSAILFLATIFGYEYDKRVLGAYEILHSISEGSWDKRCNWSCSNNLIRAFIVHPEYTECKAVRFFIARLSEVQSIDGNLPSKIPFYQTINLLGHMNFELSNAIFLKAFLRLQKQQNKDGTWGKTQKEWNTFLVTHAINRKMSLLKSQIKG